MTRARVTLRDVAELVGVNPATASRALNEHTRHRVKPETARRVETAARQLGYEPNRLARSLRTRRSYSIGVVVPDLTNPMFPPIVRGIEDALAPAGYTPLLTNTDGDSAKERRMVETLRARQVDGFVMATASAGSSAVLDLLDEGLPLVLVNRTLDRNGVIAVVPDDRRGVKQAIEHLAGLGHRAIGHVAGPQEMSTGLMRYRGFLDAMASLGLDVPDRAVVFASSFTEEAGAKAARELLSAWPACTAIVAANDLVALGVYRAAAELERAVPDDLSVVGFNDILFADKLAPPLTTIRIPVYELGTLAAQLLLERLESTRASARTMLLETQLVVRGSTAPPAG